MSHTDMQGKDTVQDAGAGNGWRERGTGTVTLESGKEMFVRFDDYTDPWSDPPVLLLLHGTAETGAALGQWVPHLCRHFRVVRPDLRGMGASAPIEPGYQLELDDLVEDIRGLAKALNVQRCFLSGEKIGGLAALAYAGKYPAAVNAISVACGVPSPKHALGHWLTEWCDLIRRDGVRAWVDATQPGRMGAELQGTALQWWSDMMASSMSVGSLIAYFEMESRLDLSPDGLRAITAPAQFMLPSRARRAAPAADQNNVAYDQRLPSGELDSWKRYVPNYFETLVESNSFHIAATRPDACAIATREFFLARLADGTAATA